MASRRSCSCSWMYSNGVPAVSIFGVLVFVFVFVFVVVSVSVFVD